MSADASSPSPLARRVLTATLAAYLGVAIWLLWRTAILEPYSDMFDWLERWFRLQAEGDYARYLWAPHNAHHLVWTFLLLDIDVRGLGAGGWAFLAAGVAGLAGTAVLLAWTAAAAASPGFRLLAAMGALALSVMGCHVLDANAAINTTYLHALVFAVAAVVLAERRPRGWAPGALICAAAAGFGNAAGLAIWPALLAGALRRRAWRWSVVVGFAGAAYGYGYVAGQPAVVAGLAHLRMIGVGQLFLTYLGLPWSRGLAPLGWAFGLVVLAAALAAVRAAGGGQTHWGRRAAMGFIVFSLGTAALAALGRGGVIAPDEPPVRYAVLLIPLQVALWIAVQPQLAVAWMRRRRTMQAASIAASAFLLAHQALMADYAIRTSDGVRAALTEFRAGRWSPAMRARVYPDRNKAAAISARLRAEGLYQRELRGSPDS